MNLQSDSSSEGEYQVLGEESLEDYDGFFDMLMATVPGDDIRVEFLVDGETVVVEGRVSYSMGEGDGDCWKSTIWINREKAPDWSVTCWDHPVEHYAKIRYGTGERVSEMDKAVVSEFDSIELVKTDRGLRTA